VAQLASGSMLAVAIPASLVSDTPHLREKTAKLGVIARACAMFGVREIIVYADESGRDNRSDLDLCMQILRFIETPQYLRKRMFPISPELKFTGILPPLQTPHHNVPNSILQCRVGDLREGIVVGRHANSLVVDVGLENSVQCPGDLPVGSRVTVRLKALGSTTSWEMEAPRTKPLETEKYWGYKVRRSKSLKGLLCENGFDLRIGTSRYGLSILDAWARLNASVRAATNILVVFGSPKLGLRELLALEGEVPDSLFDYFINTVPNQRVATVRAEEAVMVTLGLLNVQEALASR